MSARTEPFDVNMRMREILAICSSFTPEAAIEFLAEALIKWELKDAAAQSLSAPPDPVMAERKRCAEIAWEMQRKEGRSEIGNEIMAGSAQTGGGTQK